MMGIKISGAVRLDSMAHKAKAAKEILVPLIQNFISLSVSGLQSCNDFARASC